MALDAGVLAQAMLAAARGKLKKQWPIVRLAGDISPKAGSAINAAVGAARTAVNKAVCFALIRAAW
jgi:hypothetical protein